MRTTRSIPPRHMITSHPTPDLTTEISQLFVPNVFEFINWTSPTQPHPFSSRMGAPEPQLPGSNNPYDAQPPPPQQPYITDTAISTQPNYPDHAQQQQQQPPPYYPSQPGSSPTYVSPPQYTQVQQSPVKADSKYAWVFLFVGLFVGLILDVLGFCFLFCMGNDERDRKKKLYYIIGVTVSVVIWVILLFTVLQGRYFWATDD